MGTYRKLLRPACILIAAAAASAVPPLFAQAATPAPANKGFASVQEILVTSCSPCHDWTGTWEGITGNGHIIAGDPDKSYLYQRIAKDEMPQAGDKLTRDQKALIRGWILAGAPSTNLPIAVPAAAEQSSTGGPVSAAPAGTSPAAALSKVTFHEVTGFTSTALFLGAGVVGAIHFYDMMHEGHILREANHFQEGGLESVRIPLVQQAWGSDATLRWVHVGFVAAGETLYLGDAITGLSMLTSPREGKLTKHDIHRLAFFTHATLMAAQIVLGFLTTDALSRGDHDLVLGLGAAHVAIGFAIPAVMLGAGLENLLLPE